MSSQQVLPPFPVAWRTVALGTKCLSIGVTVLFAGVILLPVFLVLQYYLLNERYTAEEIRNRGIPVAPVVAGFILTLFGMMAWLTGLCLCSLAPSEANVRPMALSALACIVLFVVLVMQTSLLPALGFAPVNTRETIEGRPPRVIAVNEIGFGASAAFLVLAASILTSCSLCAIANHYQNGALAQRLHRLIVYQLAGFGGLVVVGFVYAYAVSIWPNGGFWFAAPFGAAALAILAIGCSWLLHLLKQMRALLTLAEENSQPISSME